MNGLMIAFFVILIWASIYGTFNPKGLFKRFKTVAQVLHLAEANDRSLMLFRIFTAFFAVFGFFVLWLILSGNASFNPQL